MLPRACRASSSKLAPLLGLGFSPGLPLVSLLHRSSRQQARSLVALGKAPAPASAAGPTRRLSALALAREETVTEWSEREGTDRRVLAVETEESPFQDLVKLRSLSGAELSKMDLEHVEKLLETLGTLEPTIPRLWLRDTLREAMNWLGRHLLRRDANERYRQRRPHLAALYCQALARCGQYPSLLTFLKSEKRANRVPPLMPIIDELTSSKEWRLVLQLSSGDLAPVEPSAKLLCHRMQAFLHLERYHLVLSEFAKHQSLGIQPLLPSRFHLLQAHLLRRDLESARAVLLNLKRSGQADLNAQQLAILNGYQSLGFDFEIEQQVLKDISNLKLLPPTAFLNGLLKLRIGSGDRVGAMAILKRFDLRGTKAFASRPGDGARPDLETLGCIIGLCASPEDLQLSNRFWTALRPAGEVTSELVCALVKALVRVGHVDEAVAVVMGDNLDSASPWPLSLDFEPNAQHFNPVLRVLSQRDGILGVRRVMAMMRTRGVQPDDTTVVILAEFARKVTRATTADVEALVSTLRSASPLLRPTVEQLDLVVHDIVSVAARDASEPATAKRQERLESYQSIAEYDPSSPPDAALGLSALSAFRHVMHLTLASLEDRKVKATAKAFASRLRFDATVIRDLPAANRILELMLARGFRPEPKHFAALMQGYTAVGAMRMAEDTLSLAVESGVRPNAVMLTILIDGYGQKRNGEAALDTFRKMVRYGVPPDEATATAVVHALHRSRKHALAAEFAAANHELVSADQAAVTMTGYARLAADNDFDGVLDAAESVGVPFDRQLRKMVLRVRKEATKAKSEGAENLAGVLQRVDQLLARDAKAKRQPKAGIAATKRTLAALMKTSMGEKPKRVRGGKKVNAHRDFKRRKKEEKAASQQSHTSSQS